MDEIELMLTGQLEMSKFIGLLNNNCEVQNAVRTLIPPEIASNKGSGLWKKLSFEALEKCNFDVLVLLRKICSFDNSIPDNLNIFCTIRRIYCFLHPNIVCTKSFEEIFDLYLDVIKNCFDGPEVKNLVYDIIKNASAVDSKKKKLEQAKQDIKRCFHITDNRLPRWINGPEWPMGETAPMRFVSQKRYREMVAYQFEDINTGTLKVVEQYW